MTGFIKVMPLLALFFGLTVFLGNAAVKKQNTLASDEWRFTGSDPTEPGDYIQSPENTQDECEGITNVCVVLAPADGDKPNLSAVEGLMEALESNLEHDNIIKGPYNP